MIINWLKPVPFSRIPARATRSMLRFEGLADIVRHSKSVLCLTRLPLKGGLQLETSPGAGLHAIRAASAFPLAVHAGQLALALEDAPFLTSPFANSVVIHKLIR